MIVFTLNNEAEDQVFQGIIENCMAKRTILGFSQHGSFSDEKYSALASFMAAEEPDRYNY